jgi:spore coat protein U-like protein
MMRFLSRLLPALALLAFGAPASAQVVLAANEANLAIAVSVPTACNVLSDFGAGISFAYDPLATTPTTSGTAQATVRCTRGARIGVTADGGGNAAGGARNLIGASTSELLPYSLSVVGADGTTRIALPVDTAVNTGIAGGGKTGVPVTLEAAIDDATANPSTDSFGDTVLITFSPM